MRAKFGFLCVVAGLVLAMTATLAGAGSLRLVKYDADGTQVWDPIFHDLKSDRFVGVDLFPVGDLLVFGDSFLAVVGRDGKLQEQTETTGIWLPPAIDSNGNVFFECCGGSLGLWSPANGVLWTKEIDAFNATGIQAVDDQHIFIVGDQLVDSSGTQAGFSLIRIDNDGNEKWRVNQSPPSGHSPDYLGLFAISATVPDFVATRQKWENGSCLTLFSGTGERLSNVALGVETPFGISRVLAGFDGSMVYADNPAEMVDYDSPGGFRVRKFDVDGELLWTVEPEQDNCTMCGFYDAVMARSGNIVVSGITDANGEQDIRKWVFFSIEADGTLAWRLVLANLPKRNTVWLSMLAFDPDDNLIIGGEAWHNGGEGDKTDSVALLYKVDPDGEVLWRTTYDSDYGDGRFTSAVVDDEGSIYVAGTFDGGEDDDDDDQPCGCGC